MTLDVLGFLGRHIWIIALVGVFIGAGLSFWRSRQTRTVTTGRFVVPVDFLRRSGWMVVHAPIPAELRKEIAWSAIQPVMLEVQTEPHVAPSPPILVADKAFSSTLARIVVWQRTDWPGESAPDNSLDGPAATQTNPMVGIIRQSALKDGIFGFIPAAYPAFRQENLRTEREGEQRTWKVFGGLANEPLARDLESWARRQPKLPIIMMFNRAVLIRWPNSFDRPERVANNISALAHAVKEIVAILEA